MRKLKRMSKMVFAKLFVAFSRCNNKTSQFSDQKVPTTDSLYMGVLNIVPGIVTGIYENQINHG